MKRLFFRRTVCQGLILLGAATLPGLVFAQDKPEVQAQKAGEQWLALVDAAKYGESWDAASASFKSALSRSDWIRKATTSRRTSGKLVSRKLIKSSIVKNPPNSPPGDYAGLQYHSSFLRFNAAGETVVLVLDNDGKWRVSDYIVNKTG